MQQFARRGQCPRSVDQKRYRFASSRLQDHQGPLQFQGRLLRYFSKPVTWCAPMSFQSFRGCTRIIRIRQQFVARNAMRLFPLHVPARPARLITAAMKPKRVSALHTIVAEHSDVHSDLSDRGITAMICALPANESCLFAPPFSAGFILPCLTNRAFRKLFQNMLDTLLQDSLINLFALFNQRMNINLASFVDLLTYRTIHTMRRLSR